MFRDELRNLLKRNGVSYHKPGRENLMKSKMEMAQVNDTAFALRSHRLRG